MKGHYVLATFAALALSAFAGVAVAAQPCGKAVIDDWYDNGTIDRAWDCACLRDAIERLPDIRAPYSSAQDEFLHQLDLRLCGGSSQQILTATLVTPTAEADAKESRDRWAFVLGVILAILVTAALALWAVRHHRRDA